jgi:PAS domain S-box-containing protein
MSGHEKVNILLVDDQPAKLLSYEVILSGLGENLIKASSGRQALEHLLKNEIAVVLVDVCMPDLDGFQLAAMIRDHPRFQSTSMIFISAIQVTDLDRLRGYEMGAVDYVPVPVVPEVLRAKVKVFAELFRKTRQLERLNSELERRVAERTAELEASTQRLTQSEHRRSLALASGNMGSWDWDRVKGDCLWDEGQHRIFGVDSKKFAVTPENVRALIHSDDWPQLEAVMQQVFERAEPCEAEFRVRRPDGEVRWCMGTAAATVDATGQVLRISGVTADITDRKQAEERQLLLASEVDHRAKNALALVQSVVRLTRANTIESYAQAVEGRIKALSRVHTVLSQSRWQGADLAGLVDEEMAPYRTSDPHRINCQGPKISLQPATAQTLALVLHELATNAVKYGALSSRAGRVSLTWDLNADGFQFRWVEADGPSVTPASLSGFGTRIIMASVERQLGGRVSFDWKPQGLDCTISIPQSDKLQPASGHRAAEKGSERGAHSADGKGASRSPITVMGSRIMVVEDEALVALAMSDTLADLGYDVYGPFSRVREAIAASREAAVHGAILDVNLNGEMVYPLADVLQQQGVPILFVTGYSAESIDPKFSNVPVLQKPLERQILERIFPSRTKDSDAADILGRTRAARV